MVKVGIIGCGKIAQVRHIPEYLDNPNAKLTGLYDLNLQRAKELAEKYDCKSMKALRRCWQIRKLMQSVYVWQIMCMLKLRLQH